MEKKRLVVIGGGAAGFFCAVNAARMLPGLEVVLLEKTGKILSKVRISGGGRCNVTHALFDITDMSARYPRGQHLVKKTFHQFFTTHTIQWFEERGVSLKTEKDGRMFPASNSSETIIGCLLREANKYNVDIRMNAEVKKLERGVDDFDIFLANGYHLNAHFVCIACGGYPKSALFDWIKNLGHTVAEPVPSLFTFNLPLHPITSLMGVSVPSVRLKMEGSKLTELGPLLITHWGLSGPAVLRLSAWGARELFEKQYLFKVHINWVPHLTEAQIKSHFKECRQLKATQKLATYTFESLPARLWQFLLQQAGIDDEKRFGDLPSKEENVLIRHLADYTVEVKGKTTFKEEFVTAGGVQLAEVDHNTLMSKKVSNLFFAGEILNVDGITGGFNFQHAWTSGWVVASALQKSACL